MELDNFWKHLQELEQHLDQLAQADVRHHDRLAGLSHELGGLNRTTSHLQILLGTVAAPGFSESYRSILVSAEASRQAEVVANGTAGELSGAQATRRVAERTLQQRGNAFRRGTAAARKSLREAQKRVMGLSIARVNEKMQEVQELARGARSWAEEALGRSQTARSRAEKATAQLRDFIRRIKAFLAEEGADPGSIELVARQVLNISLPSSPSQIQELLWEMRESISQLEGVDVVLNGTEKGLAMARGLLAQGQEARRVVGICQCGQDMGVVGLASWVRQLPCLPQPVSVPAQAERRLQALDRKESRAQRRLRELAQHITALQERGQDARHMAQQAKDRAQHATTTSGMLSQDLAHVTQRYMLLKNRVRVLDGVSDGALQRVTQLTAEARDLLDKASNSKRKLEDLEQRFGANERAMAAKVARLQALEQQVSGLLQEIQERANAYATC
ncbi:laminin subunit beta-2-like [Willisornis vidua]|uniref:Laminin subunit beta-2-like n=1 Tax=Willisornis vidua TaxID=1566151 RepID=A0ABQ9CUF0_9PASS|nr:laminin subunit beta-2-like [Willisornis vidua]